jgi:hypothetical protein
MAPEKKMETQHNTLTGCCSQSSAKSKVHQQYMFTSKEQRKVGLGEA